MTEPQKIKPPGRVLKKALYDGITGAANCSRNYLIMAVLSTIVATVGLYHNSAAIIIGAMVIAPLLGPNIALAFAATVGDFSLLKQASLTVLIGVLVTLALSMIIGVVVHVDPKVTEVASRTRVDLGDIAVGLASGCAGTLAFTTGASAMLIGVMVAVALLPPLATFGMLLGDGQIELAMGAFALFMMYLVCVNLASVTTFLVQGIHPATWWEKERAAKSTRIAIGLWAVLLTALIFMVYRLQNHLL